MSFRMICGVVAWPKFNLIDIPCFTPSQSEGRRVCNVLNSLERGLVARNGVYT